MPAMPITVPSWPSHSKRYAPPTRRSISHTGIPQRGGPSSQRLPSFGLVHASKTSLRGARNTRVITISRSLEVVTNNPPVLVGPPEFIISPLFFRRSSSPAITNGAGLSIRATASFLFCVRLAGLYFLKPRIQALEAALPNTPVPFKPIFKFLQRRRPQRVDAALRVYANVHEAGFTEHAEMLGDL